MCRDTENWSHDAKNILFAIKGINYILKYIRIEDKLF